MTFKKVFNMSRYLLGLALLIAVLAGCAAAPLQPDKAGEIQVSVLFFNDLHGHLKPFEVKADEAMVQVGGVARLAAEVHRIREENRRKQTPTILLVAGDILQGTPMSTVFQGEPDILCLNAMGVDAMTVGNHEFDFGMENFLRLKKLAAFPFLSANIVDKESGRLLTQESWSVPLGQGINLTVIGVTTRALLVTTKADNIASLAVLDSVEAARQAYDKVKSSGPVILLSHSRHQTDREIAAALPGLAAIIGGHDQILLSPYRQVGKVPVFQAFEKGRYLGRIDLAVDKASGKARLVRHTYIPITSALPEDDQTASIVADYDARLGARFKEVIGQSRSFLDGERDHIRYEETGLGNFITDIMVENTGAPIAMVNAGALRSSINPGPVTVADVFKAMPYANELVVVEMTGAQIKQALTRSVMGSRGDEDGGFLHVAGLRFQVRGHQVQAVQVGDHPLVESKVYRVAIPDFLASGGDGHAAFVGTPQVRTGLPLRELIVDTIRQRGVIDAKVQGRIRRLD